VVFHAASLRRLQELLLLVTDCTCSARLLVNLFWAALEKRAERR
jgi:hypothetical protein